MPCTHRWTERTRDAEPIVHSEVRHAVFLPETLSIRGNVDSVTHSRGIFAIPVYQLGLTVSGAFARPSFIQQENAVEWSGRSLAFLPSTGAFSEAGPRIHARVDVPTGEQRIAFSFPLALNGSRAVYSRSGRSRARLELPASGLPGQLAVGRADRLGRLVPREVVDPVPRPQLPDWYAVGAAHAESP